MSRASEAKLARLHDMVTDAMITELDNAKTHDLPVSPQMFSAIGKFLKDNEITCSLDGNTGASELSERMAGLREARKSRTRLRDIPMEDYPGAIQ